MMGREGRTEAEPEVCVGDVGGHGEAVRLCRWCVCACRVYGGFCGFTWLGVVRELRRAGDDAGNREAWSYEVHIVRGSTQLYW